MERTTISSSASSSRMLRLQRLCLVVAWVSTQSRTTTTAAFQHGPSWGVSLASTSLLSMTGGMRRKTKRSGTEKKGSTVDNNILEDRPGHINPDLATTLYQWEQQHRENAKLPKLSLSTRQGLRLVDQIVTEMASSPRGQKLIHGSRDIQTDLVQEGIMALMDALNEYRQSADAEQDNNTDDDEDPNKRFERYARPLLEKHLWSTLDRTARPVELPETESTVWRHIQLIRPQLRSELGGREPTVEELAARLELPSETLELLLAARRNSLSVESTVEILTPESLEDKSTHFTNQEDWDSQEGHLLDTGDGIPNKEVLVEEYQDEMYQYEGEDEMWLHQTQIAAPLREIIPDGGPSPDDLALSEMIRHDVGDLLTQTLTPQEVQAVRMAFGFDGKQDIVWEEIAIALDGGTATDVSQLMTPLEVKKLLKGALEKLRTTYRQNWVESYVDEDFEGDTV